MYRPYNKPSRGKNIIIFILVCIIIVLGVCIYFIYNDSSKQQIELRNEISDLKDELKEEKKKDVSVNENDTLKHVQGDSSSLIYSEKEAYYFVSTSDQLKPMLSTKLDLQNKKISDAKIIKNALRNDNKETLFIILNDGTVKYGFLSGQTSNNLKLEYLDFPILKGQKIKTINSITVDTTNKITCNVILTDNTTKNIEGFI